METTSEVDIAKTIGAGDVTFSARWATAAVRVRVRSVISRWRLRRVNAGSGWRGARENADPVSALGPAWRRFPSAPAQWTRPWGLLRPADEIAMLTRRYMHETGATRDHLANVALAVRRMANANPKAVMYERSLSREQYMEARWISEPLCLFDNCLETDGALACVLVAADRAADCPEKPVYVHSFAQGLPSQSHTMVNYWCDDPLEGPSWTCSKQLYRDSDFQAGRYFGGPALRCLYAADSALARRLWILRKGRRGGIHRGRCTGSRGSAAHQHVGGGPLRGVCSRLQPDQRGSAPDARNLGEPGSDASSCLVTAGEGVPTSAMILRR